MAILGTSTNYQKTESPTRRYYLKSFTTGLVIAYRDESERTYEWVTDAAGYSGALINPETLAATWSCSQYNSQVPFGKAHGKYTEIWIYNSGWTYLP
jgi:hypothetical protein